MRLAESWVRFMLVMPRHPAALPAWRSIDCLCNPHLTIKNRWSLWYRATGQWDGYWKTGR